MQTRHSCRQAFGELKILTEVNLYILETATHIHLKFPELATAITQLHNYNIRESETPQNLKLALKDEELIQKRPLSKLGTVGVHYDSILKLVRI